MAFDIGVWEAAQDLPPPDPISGSGVSTVCIGVTPAQLTLVRDQLLAAIATAKQQILAAMPTGFATKADLDAATAEILEAIAAIPTAPSTAGYAMVGGTRFAKLTDAATAVAEGGVVEVYGEMLDLNATAGFLKSCTIRGMTPDAKLTWTLGTTERMAFGKGHIVCAGAGKTYLIENLEISGARVVDRNGAAIRGDEAASITVRNCNIHDNENGILSIADRLFLYGNTFKNNGNSSGSGHGVYVNSTNVLEVVAEGNNFFTALIGNQFKSRAKKTLLRRNTVAELDGSCSWQIDLSNGGDALIEKNVIEQGPNADNWNLVSYAPEGAPVDGRTNALAFIDNIVINDHTQAWGLNLFLVPGALSIARNIWIGPFDEHVVGATLDSTNTVYATRAAAGYAAYPFLPGVPA